MTAKSQAVLDVRDEAPCRRWSGPHAKKSSEWLIEAFKAALSTAEKLDAFIGEHDKTVDTDGGELVSKTSVGIWALEELLSEIGVELANVKKQAEAVERAMPAGAVTSVISGQAVRLSRAEVLRRIEAEETGATTP